MWIIDYEKPSYYIVNEETGRRVKVKPLTVGELKNGIYGGKYYGKAFVACEKANGKTVWLDRVVNGRVIPYQYKRKQPME